MPPITSPEGLFDLVQAPIRWQALELAFRRNIFDLLNTFAPASKVASSYGFDFKRTKLYLDALTAMGVLVKSDDQYQVSPLLREHLLTDGTKSMRETLLTLASIRHGDLNELLEDKKDIAPIDMNAPAFWDRSALSLQSYHRSFGAEKMLACLTGLPEWSSARHVVDLAAGSSALALAILAADPKKRVTMIDLAPMAERINHQLSTVLDDAQRITVMAGDFKTCSLPQDADIVWVSMALYYAGDLALFFERIYAALPKSAIFVSHHEGLINQRTAPEPHIIGRLIPAMKGADSSFNATDISDAMTVAGFDQVEETILPCLTGDKVLTIGRKRPSTAT